LKFTNAKILAIFFFFFTDLLYVLYLTCFGKIIKLTSDCFFLSENVLWPLTLFSFCLLMQFKFIDLPRNYSKHVGKENESFAYILLLFGLNKTRCKSEKRALPKTSDLFSSALFSDLCLLLDPRSILSLLFEREFVNKFKIKLHVFSICAGVEPNHFLCWKPVTCVYVSQRFVAVISKHILKTYQPICWHICAFEH
jgi:hypothetical protein